MYIKSLDLKNFRNYENLHVDLSEGTNLFYGNNAQGKTNILEAIYVCSVSRSHRGARDKEMISLTGDEAHLRCDISKRGLSHRIDVHLKKNKNKGIALDGLPVRHTKQILGMLHVIIFSPEDLRLIKEEPKRRRRFMDMELCQLDPVYADALSKYQKAVMQKNALLKEIYFKPELKDTLEMWQDQQVRYGRIIIKSRRDFIDRLNKIMQKIHYDLSGGLENIEVKYVPSVTEEFFKKKLIQDQDREIRMQKSLSGPQIDDLVFEINGNDVRMYGSQGQQRTSALSLKMAEIELVKSEIHDTPVLLLDDVMSELDGSRQRHLTELIRGTQTLITCTGMEDIKRNTNVEKVFCVKAGTLKEEY